MTMRTEGSRAASPDRRVLAVDDDEEVRRLISLVLGPKGYQVTIAESGRAALEHLEREPFDLVITDLKMPEMDGLALLKECKTRYPEMEVMVLTAYGTIQSAVYAMKRGAIDYVTKPFSVSDLRQKVASCFERRGARAELPARHPVQPLVELNRILSSQIDLSDTLDSIIDLTHRVFRSAATQVAVFDESLEEGAIVVASGEHLARSGHPRLTSQAARRLAEQPEPWLLRDVEAAGGQSITVPLLGGTDVIGTLTLNRKSSSPPFSQADAQLLQVFGFQIGLSMLHVRTRQRLFDSFRDLHEVTLDAVRALFEALRTFDQYTHDHSQRVSRFARLLGQRIGLPKDQLETLSIAGLLHDLGKLGVGDEALHKNGGLTSSELDRVKLHPVMGARILAGMSAFAEIVPIVLHHHERYDGRGYPGGLSGEDIPLGARIVGIVDSYDSMTSDRPYRRAISIDRALANLRDGADTQLDGRLVEGWVSVVRSELVAGTVASSLKVSG